MNKFIRIKNRYFDFLKAAIQGKYFEFAYYGLGLTSNKNKLLALKNRYVGRRAFIIGNGPSLRNTDIQKLKGEITIGSNSIFLLFEDTGFRPTFYTVEDRLVAEDRALIINKLTGATKIIPFDLRIWLKPSDENIYINFIRSYPDFPRFSSNFERRAYWGGTVTFFNLQLAYYLGIREVYLIGVDHSYQPPAQIDEVEGNIIISHSDDINHFHPDYFGQGYRWHDPKVDRMEQAYMEAKRYFESHGGVIYNATIGGKLEVFPRVDFKKLWDC